MSKSIKSEYSQKRNSGRFNKSCPFCKRGVQVESPHGIWIHGRITHSSPVCEGYIKLATLNDGGAAVRNLIKTLL